MSLPAPSGTAMTEVLLAVPVLTLLAIATLTACFLNAGRPAWSAAALVRPIVAAAVGGSAQHRVFRPAGRCAAGRQVRWFWPTHGWHPRLRGGFPWRQPADRGPEPSRTCRSPIPCRKVDRMVTQAQLLHRHPRRRDDRGASGLPVPFGAGGRSSLARCYRANQWGKALEIGGLAWFRHPC
jgi:hypothetical protein